MIAALVALTLALAAEPVEIRSAGDLKATGDQLAGEAEAKGIAGKTLGAGAVWRRSKSGMAELHKTKTDLIVIQQGSATLVFGGRIPKAQVGAPNEMRGTSIEGGESRKVGPGDIIRIPAGTAHQFVLEKGQSVAYFAVKIAR